jgi:hypothetical protein
VHYNGTLILQKEVDLVGKYRPCRSSHNNRRSTATTNVHATKSGRTRAQHEISAILELSRQFAIPVGTSRVHRVFYDHTTTLLYFNVLYKALRIGQGIKPNRLLYEQTTKLL